MFITFEGGEGTGKSTQARLLVERLNGANIRAQYTREPGGTPNAETLRELLLDRSRAWAMDAEVLLHFAARAEHIAVAIRPALDGGLVVVCDRFADSTLAYQGFGLGANIPFIVTLTGLLPILPKITIVLDVPSQVAARRLASRRQALDRYEAMDAAFHERVCHGFREIAKAAPERCVLIPAEDDIETVHRQVWRAIAPRLLPLLK